MRFLTLLLFSTGLLRAGGALPPSFRGKGLNVELVCEVTSVHPGQPFYAGLFIHHDEGYHTYWLNPGLAGVRTNLEWKLPDGWTAGGIEWPAPDKVMMAQIATHGFERDVLLMAKITPPAKAAGSVTLTVKASWMCCARVCHPGFCDLALTLPVASGAEPAWDARWHPVFKKERAAFPVKLEGWSLTAARKGAAIVLTGTAGRGGRMPEQPQFFSSDNLICSHPPQIWRRTGSGFEAELTVSDLPPKDQSVLRGVLCGKSGWRAGDGRAVNIAVPVR